MIMKKATGVVNNLGHGFLHVVRCYLIGLFAVFLLQVLGNALGSFSRYSLWKQTLINLGVGFVLVWFFEKLTSPTITESDS